METHAGRETRRRTRIASRGADFSRRLCIGLSGVCAVILGVPLVGFIVAPLFRKTPQQWIPLGKTGEFEIGKTVNVSFNDPSPLPWAGITRQERRVAAAGVRDGVHRLLGQLHAPRLPGALAAGVRSCSCAPAMAVSITRMAPWPPARRPIPLIRYEVRVVQ